MIEIKDFTNATRQECEDFLAANWGLRGYNATGLTLFPENRDLETLRKECEIQSKIK